MHVEVSGACSHYKHEPDVAKRPPKRNVKPIRRYSPSGSAMSRQTLTEISEAKLDEETSMVSADVSARTPSKER